MAVQLTIQRVVTVDGLSFTVKPESYLGFLGTLERVDRLFPDETPPVPKEPAAEPAAKDPGPDRAIRALALMQLGLMARIDAWEGLVLPDGTPAPCNDENKMQLFGLRPDLLLKLGKALKDAELAELKNSGPSQDG